MKTENLTITEAINALNTGYKLTHPGIEKRAKYVIKDACFDSPIGINTDKGCDPRIPYGDVYWRKYVYGLMSLNHENELVVCSIVADWKNNEPEKDFGEYETGWSIINDTV